MENPSSPKRAVAAGSDNVGYPICDGVEMDAQRQYRPVREGASRCKSVRTCEFSVQIVVIFIPC